MYEDRNILSSHIKSICPPAISLVSRDISNLPCHSKSAALNNLTETVEWNNNLLSDPSSNPSSYAAELVRIYGARAWALHDLIATDEDHLLLIVCTSSQVTRFRNKYAKVFTGRNVVFLTTDSQDLWKQLDPALEGPSTIISVAPTKTMRAPKSISCTKTGTAMTRLTPTTALETPRPEASVENEHQLAQINAPSFGVAIPWETPLTTGVSGSELNTQRERAVAEILYCLLPYSYTPHPFIRRARTLTGGDLRVERLVVSRMSHSAADGTVMSSSDYMRTPMDSLLSPSTQEVSRALFQDYLRLRSNPTNQTLSSNLRISVTDELYYLTILKMYALDPQAVDPALLEEAEREMRRVLQAAAESSGASSYFIKLLRGLMPIPYLNTFFKESYITAIKLTHQAALDTPSNKVMMRELIYKAKSIGIDLSDIGIDLSKYSVD